LSATTHGWSQRACAPSPQQQQQQVLSNFQATQDLSHIHEVYEHACSRWAALLDHFQQGAPSSLPTVAASTSAVQELAAAPALPPSGLEAAEGRQAALAATAATALLTFTPPPQATVPTAASLGRSASGSQPLNRSRALSLTATPTPRAAAAVASNSIVGGSSTAALSRQFLAHADSWSDVRQCGVVLPAMAAPRDPVPPSSVLQQLPWLLQDFPGMAVAVIAADTAPWRSPLSTLHSPMKLQRLLICQALRVCPSAAQCARFLWYHTFLAAAHDPRFIICCYVFSLFTIGAPFLHPQGRRWRCSLLVRMCHCPR
jgi:hypothetical protein